MEDKDFFINSDGEKKPKYSASGTSSEGKEIFLASSEWTKEQEDRKWEAHKKDLQGKADAIRAKKEVLKKFDSQE